MIIMSIGALMDAEFYLEIEKIAKENGAKVHLPSGAIVGLDGIKAVAKFGLKEVSLVTRKSPKSLGKKIDVEEVLFDLYLWPTLVLVLFAVQLLLVIIK